ncbi:MAG: aldolase/citrate lyase family protein, partial [Candidatus Margulisiibacteriota bacterium]
KAIESLEGILNTPGIDGSIIGPYDLSGSLGYPGEFDRAEVKEALIKYEQICKKMKKPMGIHSVQPDPKLASQYINKGYSLIAVGVDELYLGQMCRDVLKGIKKS